MNGAVKPVDFGLVKTIIDHSLGNSDFSDFALQFGVEDLEKAHLNQANTFCFGMEFGIKMAMAAMAGPLPAIDGKLQAIARDAADRARAIRADHEGDQAQLAARQAAEAPKAAGKNGARRK